jgi:hypothetical protein
MDLLDKIQAKIQQLTSPDVKDYNLVRILVLNLFQLLTKEVV